MKRMVTSDNKPVMAASALALCLALSACGFLFSEPPAKPRHKAIKPHYTAADYVENLALARLELAATPEAVPTEQVDVIKAYHAQRKKTPPRQSVLVIEYRLKNVTPAQRIVAPISLDAADDFTALRNIVDALNRMPNTLHALSVRTTSILPDKSLSLPADDAGRLAVILEEQQQKIVARGENLTLYKDMTVQLKLIQFFIKHRLREAAYLSVDNVKQALAAATENKAIGDDTLRELSRELESLESDMHQLMPFTLSSLPFNSNAKGA